MLEPFEDFIREIAASLGSARSRAGTAVQNADPLTQAEVIEPESSRLRADRSPHQFPPF